MKKYVVRHKDFNKFNNFSDNLIYTDINTL